MYKKFCLSIVIIFVLSLYSLFSADRDTIVINVYHAEIHSMFLMEGNTENKFIDVGLLTKYGLFSNNKSENIGLSAIFDLDYLIGFYGTKKVININFLTGLREGTNFSSFNWYFEILTGLGNGSDHVNSNGYSGIFSRIKVGLSYKMIALEISDATFVSKDFTLSLLSGIGLSYSL